MQKITPFLWFNGKVEDIVNFYTGIFKDAKIYNEMSGPGGTISSVKLELCGQEFTIFNGGPAFKFNEAISLVVNCETQEEIDRMWEQLSADGGITSRCGWLKDKYGLSWQVVPHNLIDLLKNKNEKKADKTMQVFLKMNKIIIADLLKAAK